MRRQNGEPSLFEILRSSKHGGSQRKQAQRRAQLDESRSRSDSRSGDTFSGHSSAAESLGIGSTGARVERLVEPEVQTATAVDTHPGESVRDGGVDPVLARAGYAAPSAPEVEHDLDLPAVPEVDLETFPYANRLPELPETEQAPPEPHEPTTWDWLNTEVPIRHATLIVVVLMLLLVIAGAYLMGGGGAGEGIKDVEERLFTDAYETPPWFPDPEQTQYRKEMFREVRSDVEVSDQPSAVPTPVGEAPRQSFGVIVAQSPDLGGSNKLVIYLDDFEDRIGTTARIDRLSQGRGKDPLYRVYYGPYDTIEAANRVCGLVKKLRTYKGTRFSDAFILPDFHPQK